MGFDRRVVDIIDAVGRGARIGQVTGIDAMGCHLVGVHVDQIAKVLMRCRAMAAFQKTVDRVLPVGLYVISQPMGKSEIGNIRRPERPDTLQKHISFCSVCQRIAVCALSNVRCKIRNCHAPAYIGC